MNAFTKKPDLSKFLKQVRHSENARKQGRNVRDNPTPEQRHLMFAKINETRTR